MRTDKDWNVMSPKDSMLLALINSLDTKSSNSKNKSKNRNKDKRGEDKTTSDKDTSSDKEKVEAAKKKKERYDKKIPDWKKVAPKQNEPKTKVIDEKTCH